MGFVQKRIEREMRDRAEEGVARAEGSPDPLGPRGYKEPVEGSMHVVGATQPDPSRLRAPCHITYVIQAEGVEPFSGETEVECWTRQWPKPGEDLPVVFDRRHPQKVEIQWDRITSHAESARMHADQLAAELRGEGGAGTPGG
jgi:hypothetical protein